MTPPTKAEVNYRLAMPQVDENRRCNNCGHDRNGWCKLLDLRVYPVDVCDAWIKK